MSSTASFTELDGQHVELLPARTVLSTFIHSSGGQGGSAHSGDNQPFAPHLLALLGLGGTSNGVPGTNTDGNSNTG